MAKGARAMSNQEYKNLRSFKTDYAKKPEPKNDWRGLVLTVIVIAAWMGLLAIELAVMDGSF